MKEKALDNKCPSCGAPILFNIKEQKWVCEYCNSSFSIEELQKYNNASSKENNKKECSTTKEVKKVKKVDNTTYVSYRCKDCGAEIIADENTASTFCVYCGNTAILKDKLSGEFAPSKIIPFKKEKSSAIDSFKSLNKGRPLMPNFFNDEKNIEKISGVYIPFWLYDYNVKGGISAKGTNVKSWRVGDIMYTKTDIYDITREGEMNYSKIPCDGSTRFPDDIMQSIEPFDYKDMIDYNHAYLSGFLAEKYDVEGEEPQKETTNRAITSSIYNLQKDIKHYDSLSIKENTLKATLKNREYVLLPVWMVNVKYRDKYYTFAENGQTGEFIGNIPVDIKKAIKYILIHFFGSALIVLLVSYIIFIVGK